MHLICVTCQWILFLKETENFSLFFKLTVEESAQQWKEYRMRRLHSTHEEKVKTKRSDRYMDFIPQFKATLRVNGKTRTWRAECFQVCQFTHTITHTLSFFQTWNLWSIVLFLHTNHIHTHPYRIRAVFSVSLQQEEKSSSIWNVQSLSHVTIRIWFWTERIGISKSLYFMDNTHVPHQFSSSFFLSLFSLLFIRSLLFFTNGKGFQFQNVNVYLSFF